jgi:hypothetical protein
MDIFPLAILILGILGAYIVYHRGPNDPHWP